MKLSLSHDHLIFIEKNAFLETDFLPFLEEVFRQIETQNINVLFYTEVNLEKEIEEYKRTLNYRNAYIIEGFLDVLKQRNLLKAADTKGFLELSEIKEILNQNPNKEVLFITQKENVFNSLNLLKNHHQKISIYKFHNGALHEWQKAVKKLNDAFYLEEDKYINQVDIEQLDYVFSPVYGYLKLDKRKSLEGGEGVLYQTFNNLLCKLYFKEHQTYVNYKKLQRMLEIDIYNPYVNWPKDIIYYKNDFVGYVMEEIKDAKTLDYLRANLFKGYKGIDIYELAYHLLLNIEYLHNKNILIGDLKLDNILVKSKTEVFLIDCGCYQIEDYPCDVCNASYTKRAFTGIELKRTLRTFDDEYFPINKILFEILVGKNPHYNRESGVIDAEDINNFYYPLDLSNVKIDTPDLILWKRLSKRMREFFYYYFKENKVTSISEWINELKLYINYAKQMQKHASKAS